MIHGSEQDGYHCWLDALRRFVPPGARAPKDLDWDAIVAEDGEIETDLGSWMILVETPWLGREERLAATAASARPTAAVSTEVFSMTERGIYAVSAEFWHLVDSSIVRNLAAGHAEGSRLLAGSVSAYAFLDGGVVYSEQEDPDSWDDDAVDDGIWLVGDAALRAVCDVLSLATPDEPQGAAAGRGRRDRKVDLDARRTRIPDPDEQAEMLTTWSGIRQLAQASNEDDV